MRGCGDAGMQSWVFFVPRCSGRDAAQEEFVPEFTESELEEYASRKRM